MSPRCSICAMQSIPSCIHYAARLPIDLQLLAGAVGIGRGKRQHARMVNHPLAGRKVAAKYEDPETGAAWAGRGATPRRLRVYEEVGRSREEFSLKSRSAGGAKKPGRKPGRPKKVRR
jgi:hypothetical protein